MRVTIYVPLNGSIEGITPPYRAFHTANDFLTASGKEPVFGVEYVGLLEHIPANNGEYMIKTNRLLQDVTETNLLIIPPLFGDISKAVDANAPAIPFIKKLFHQGASLASLCVGAFLLAETGLLNDKKCSTHWAFMETFKERYPQVEVENGSVISIEENIYSSGGANSLWNLILYLIEKFADRETAVMISKYFALDIGRESQSQFTIFRGQRNHGDTDIIRVQDYIETKFKDKITIQILANLINTGRRTLERRFKEATNNTPMAYIQRVRMEAAKNYFETTRMNINEVMFDVGYSDAKAFREIFKNNTGLTPGEYRKRYAWRDSSLHSAKTTVI